MIYSIQCANKPLSNHKCTISTLRSAVPFLCVVSTALNLPDIMSRTRVFAFLITDMQTTFPTSEATIFLKYPYAKCNVFTTNIFIITVNCSKGHVFKVTHS